MEKIMKTSDHVTHKQIRIKGYKEKEWQKVCLGVMEEGIRLKFSSNEKLKEKLLGTGSKLLAEASPTDAFWGVGCPMYGTRISQKSLWGKNHLGKLLMAIRQKLKH